MNFAPPVSSAIVVQTQEEERYRLARALHNGPGQLLANAALEIETVLRLLDDDPAAARQGLRALLAELQEGFHDVRRMVHKLQPPLLNDLGLRASLEKTVAEFSARTGIAATLNGWEHLTDRLPASVETAIFRIAHEALENVAEHSGASRVQLTLTATANAFHLEIEDNGKGFDPRAYGKTNGERRLGLLAMNDRAEFLGGDFRIYSEPGYGTRLVLEVPR